MNNGIYLWDIVGNFVREKKYYFVFLNLSIGFGFILYVYWISYSYVINFIGSFGSNFLI